MSAELDRRWGFLAPWCAALKGLLHYKYPTHDEALWGHPEAPPPSAIPDTLRRYGAGGDFYWDGDDEIEFSDKFQKSARRWLCFPLWLMWTNQRGDICWIITAKWILAKREKIFQLDFWRSWTSKHKKTWPTKAHLTSTQSSSVILTNGNTLQTPMWLHCGKSQRWIKG